MIYINQGKGKIEGTPIHLMAELMAMPDELDSHFGEGTNESRVLRMTVAEWVKDPTRVRREVDGNA